MSTVEPTVPDRAKDLGYALCERAQKRLGRR